jgi:WD40 repeat protein
MQSGVAADGNTSHDKLKLFVSYSRRDIAIADALVAALEADGFDVTIDRRDLPYGEQWQNELADFIRACDTVVWLVSPDSVRSRWCNWELGEVSRINKRFIPVRIRDIDAADLPEALGKIHLLPAEGAFAFEQHLKLLVEVLQTDRPWIKEATRLADRAHQWITHNRAGAMMLRGSALKDAEAWRDRQPRAAPPPSREVLDLILASRRAATRRGRWWATASACVALIGFGLAGAAFWYAGLAVKNERLANEKTLEATKSQKLAEENAERATANERLAQQKSEEAQRNQKLAEENARIANDERVKNQESSSRAVAMASQQLVSENRPALAQIMALEGLPQKSPPERPLVDVALKSLYRAVRADRAIVELHVPNENVLSAAFTPDGRYLLNGTSEGSLIVWDMASYQKLHHIKTDNDTITLVDPSPDGKSVLVSGGRSPGIWEIASGSQVWVLPKVERGYVRAARFSPDGKRIALGYNTNKAEIRDLSGKLEHMLEGPADFATAYKQRKTSIWGDTGVADPIVMAVEEATWRMFGGMSEVLFTPDGKVLATAGAADAAGAARLYDAAAGKLIATLEGDSLPNNYGNQRLVFSADGKLVATAARDYKVRVWSVPDGKSRAELAHTTEPQAIAFDPGGAFVAAGYADGSVRVWSTEDGSLLSVFNAHIDSIMSIAYSPDQQLLVTSAEDRSVRLWWNTLDAEQCKAKDRRFCDSSMRPADTLRGHTDTTHLVIFSPDGSRVASVSRDATVRIWQVRDAGMVSLPHDGTKSDDKPQLPSFVDPSFNIVFSGDGKSLLASTHFRSFTIWDLAERRVLCRKSGDRLSRRGDGTVMLHMTPFDKRPADCQAGAISSSYRSERDLGDDLRHSSNSDNYWRMGPDGTRAVSAHEDRGFSPGSDDAPPRLLDVASKNVLATLSHEGRPAKAVQLSRDGSTVVGGLAVDEDGRKSEGRQFGVWIAANGELVAVTPDWKLDFDSVVLSRNGRQLLLVRSRSRTAVRIDVKGKDDFSWQTMLGPRQVINGGTISDDGEMVAVAYVDGTVQLYTGRDGKSFAALSSGGHPIKKMLFSGDGRLLAGIDANNAIWLWEVSSGVALATVALRSEPVALVFSPGNDRLAVQTKDAQMHLIATGLDWLGLARPEDLIDLTRGTLAASLSEADRKRFLLESTAAAKADDGLAALVPIEVPKPSIDGSRPATLKACDDLAANPTDRYRQAKGVVFEKLDIPKALAACEAAVAAVPGDTAARYQRGRVHERAGRIKEAVAEYKTAADAGHAAAARRIGQLISMKSVGPEHGLGGYEGWMDKGAKAGDAYALMDAALRHAVSLGVHGATQVLREAAAAQDGKVANAALQLGLDLDKRAANDAKARDLAYFYLQLAQRFAQSTPPDQIDAKLQEDAADRLRILPRQIAPPRLVELYRAARDWRPAGG